VDDVAETATLSGRDCLGKARITIREGNKVSSIYMTKEEKANLERIKRENGLRSLREAYLLWTEHGKPMSSSEEKPKPIRFEELEIDLKLVESDDPELLEEIDSLLKLDDAALREKVPTLLLENARLKAQLLDNLYTHQEEIKRLNIGIATLESNEKALSNMIDTLRGKKRKRNNPNSM